MTNEELEKAMQEVGEKIKNLPEDEKSLSKKERKQRGLLLSQKVALDRIKLAREKNDKDSELQHTITYGMLTSWLGRHPYLMHVFLNARGSRRVF